MPDVIRVNSIVYSWTSTLFKFDGQPWQGVLSMDYEQKRERKVVYGARQDGQPLGVTSGKYEVPSFSMKMLKDSADNLTDYLSVKGLGSYGDADFTILVQVVEPVLGAFPITVLASPCWITGKKDAHEEGIDELVTEFEVKTLALVENGKRLWSVVRGLGSVGL